MPHSFDSQAGYTFMRSAVQIMSPLLILVGSVSCAGLQMGDILNPSDSDAPLTESTVIEGLKEALRLGTERTSSTLSEVGGFSDDAVLRIVYPEELETVTGALRRIGLGDQVNEFETSMNRAAEQAAGEAVDVFVSAITSMSVVDAFGILNGANNAATEYFRERTSVELRSRFSPVIRNVMEDVGVYQAYSDLVGVYNAIPLTKPVSVDLEEHILDGTLNGLFRVLAEEERRIRIDPLARTTALLQRVFRSRS